MTSSVREEIRSTHPFVDFTFDLRRLSYLDWLLLGEAASKSEHLASVALLPETAARLHRLQLVRGVLGTAAIEGNTLTADEVERHLEGRLNLPRSRDYLGREIDNIVRLCNAELALLNTGGERRLSADTIAEFNRGILEGLPVAEDAEPGRYRRHRVGVGRYLALPPELARDATQEMCDWLSEPWGPPESHSALGIVRAVLAHLYLAWIHPFGDGNGRTARLVEFQILLAAGFPTPCAHILSNHYNQTRTEYYRVLDASSREEGPLAFVQYALRGFVDGLREHLTEVYAQQRSALWPVVVDNQLGVALTAAANRRRLLACELGAVDRGVAVADVPMLSPRVAAAYGGLERKAVRRDVEALVKAGVAELVEGRVRATTEVLDALRAARRAPAPGPV